MGDNVLKGISGFPLFAKLSANLPDQFSDEGRGGAKEFYRKDAEADGPGGFLFHQKTKKLSHTHSLMLTHRQALGTH